MRLDSLSPNPGAKHRIKRLGCGESSGHGKTSGKGHKGQKARAGGPSATALKAARCRSTVVCPRRASTMLPSVTTGPASTSARLDEVFEDGDEVNEVTLRDAKLVKGRWDGVKILGFGEITKKLTVNVDRISASAREKIEKAGGTVTSRGPAAE